MISLNYEVMFLLKLLILSQILCSEYDRNWPALGKGNQQQQSSNNNQWSLNNNNNQWPALGRGQQQSPDPTPSWVRPSNTNNNNYQQNNRHQTVSNNNYNTVVKPGEVTDEELRFFSEDLLRKDSNNAAQFVSINYQGRTTSRSSRDEAPMPLLHIDSAAYNLPTVSKMIKLYDNYILESNQREDYTAQEKSEEDAFLNAIVNTPVMEYTRNFLTQKGAIGTNPSEFKNILKQIWFNMYSRGQGRIGSSGFEHIFLAEIKKGAVSGLHNWLYFSKEENAKQANYLGYMKKVDLNGKGAIVRYHFTFHGIDKPVGSMFIGTSPEFELALYSTCFLLRADKNCPLKLNGNRVSIKTFTYRFGGKNLIGSAFPEI